MFGTLLGVAASMLRSLAHLLAAVLLAATALTFGGCLRWVGTQNDVCLADVDCDIGQVCVQDPDDKRTLRCAIPCKDEGAACREEGQYCVNVGAATEPLLYCYPDVL